MRRIYRLNGKENFRLLFRRGRSIEASLFKIVLKKNVFSHSRFAFIVPKASSKKATVRNRLRRRAKEWIRKNSNILNSSMDLAVIFKKDAATATSAKFYEELGGVFRKIFNGNSREHY